MRNIKTEDIIVTKIKDTTANPAPLGLMGFCLFNRSILHAGCC